MLSQESTAWSEWRSVVVILRPKYFSAKPTLLVHLVAPQWELLPARISCTDGTRFEGGSDERNGCQERKRLSCFCGWRIPSPLVGQLFQFAGNNILFNRSMQSRIPSYDPACFETPQDGGFILQTILKGESHSQSPEKLYWRERKEVSTEDRSRAVPGSVNDSFSSPGGRCDKLGENSGRVHRIGP